MSMNVHDLAHDLAAHFLSLFTNGATKIGNIRQYSANHPLIGAIMAPFAGDIAPYATNFRHQHTNKPLFQPPNSCTLSFGR